MNLIDWLQKRLSRNLQIDEWQRFTLVKLLDNLIKNK